MLRAIKLPPGVVRGSTDAASRGRWWDTNLIRWQGGHMKPIGGWQRMTPTPLASMPRRIWSWRSAANIRYIVALCDGHIYTSEGGGFTNRAPVDFVGDATLIGQGGYGIGPYGDDTYGTPRVLGDARLYRSAASWSADSFGQDVLMVASSDGRLLKIAPNGAALPALATVVANAPTSNRAMLVTDERHVMLIGSGGERRRVAWCDREDYNNWDFADITNTAGYLDLDTPGWLTQACKVRGGVLVFAENEVWLGRYRGQPDIYGFERVGRDCSLLAPQAFATAAGTVFWMSRNSFWFFDGQTARVLPCDVGDYVFDTMDELAGPVRSHALVNGAFPEVWFFYPSTGQTECDRYVIYNYEERWWATGSLARSAGLGAGVYPYPIMACCNGHLHSHENGWTAAGLTRAGDVYAESGAFSVDQGGDRTMHVLGAQMDSGHGYAATQFRAYTRDTRDAADAEAGPFVPRSDGWTDCRFSGRDIRLRVEATQDADWGIGEMRFDVKPGGRR
jgi:hypothetical protein